MSNGDTGVLPDVSEAEEVAAGYLSGEGFVDTETDAYDPWAEARGAAPDPENITKVTTTAARRVAPDVREARDVGIEGARMRGEAEAAGAEAQADILSGMNQQMAQANLQYAEEMSAWDDRMAQARRASQAAMDAAAANKVNPGQFFANIGTAGTYAAAIGVAAGHLASALGGGPNTAFDTLKAAIDRNVDAQVQNQKNLLGISRERNSYLDQLSRSGVHRANVQNLYTAQLYKHAEQQLLEQAKRTASETARAAILETASKLSMEAAKLNIKIEEANTVMTQIKHHGILGSQAVSNIRATHEMQAGIPGTGVVSRPPAAPPAAGRQQPAQQPTPTAPTTAAVPDYQAGPGPVRAEELPTREVPTRGSDRAADLARRMAAGEFKSRAEFEAARGDLRAKSGIPLPIEAVMPEIMKRPGTTVNVTLGEGENTRRVPLLLRPQYRTEDSLNKITPDGRNKLANATARTYDFLDRAVQAKALIRKLGTTSPLGKTLFQAVVSGDAGKYGTLFAEARKDYPDKARDIVRLERLFEQAGVFARMRDSGEREAIQSDREADRFLREVGVPTSSEKLVDILFGRDQGTLEDILDNMIDYGNERVEYINRYYFTPRDLTAED